MANASKRINLAAPLLSVRRHGGAGAEMPSCKPDATPGGVPFGWEHRPGHPKSVRTRRAPPPPPATAPDERAVVAAAAPVSEESEWFSDALSRVDSCLTVNCSITGLSEAGGKPAACGGVMMDRFLPAAQAVAAGSQQCTFRKAGTAAAGASAQEATRPAAPINARTGDGDRSPWRLRVEHSPSSVNHVPSNNANDRNEEDDDEWDEHSTRGFASKRCGLLPTRCVKSAFLLLNPAHAIRRGGGGARRGRGKRFLAKVGRGQRATKPLVRRQRNGQHLGHDASSKSWEEVYINSLLRSDRDGRKGAGGGDGAMASELDRTARELCTGQGEVVHRKASRLGLLLLFDNDSTQAEAPDAGHNALLPPPKGSRPAKPNDGKRHGRDAGYGFPLLLEKVAASRGVVSMLLPLPPPNAPSESWLSRALPSVSSKPPATSFLGMRVQPNKRAPPPWCSGDQTTAMIDHAAPW